MKASDRPLEDIVLNIIKTNIDDFTGTALRTIDYLERTDNRLSVKDALISLKEICVEKINPFYKTANIILTVLFSNLQLPPRSFEILGNSSRFDFTFSF